MPSRNGTAFFAGEHSGNASERQCLAYSAVRPVDRSCSNSSALHFRADLGHFMLREKSEPQSEVIRSIISC